MADRFEPHLLAITGDIWCADDKAERGPELMERDLEFLGSLGTPWAFVWGNHDYVGDWAEAMARIAAAPNAVAPRGDGRGSFRVELVMPSCGRAVWDLFFLNSGPEWHLPGDLEWFVEESAHIKARRGRTVPAIVYVHIPMRPYETAAASGDYTGVAGGGIHCWGDDGSAFSLLTQPGNVRACFVGHSHKNDFWFEKEGVVLAYGRASGYGGVGGEVLRKGAKLLSLECDPPRFAFETVFADGTTWGRSPWRVDAS